MNESTPHPPQEPHIPGTRVSGKKIRLGIGQAAAQLWDEAVQETRARQAPQTRPSREWFERLPSINRFLLGSGSVCVLAGLFCLIVIPLLGSANSSLRSAFYPFTSEGKRETCLSNLQRVSAALAQYSQDYDGRYPLAEYEAGGKRRTWMAQLRQRGVEEDIFVCPAGSGGGNLQATGSYGLNPVLAGQSLAEEEANAGRVILLADRGERHDSILLPPFVGWSSSDKDADGEKGNLSANHSENTAVVLYADGHAGAQQLGSWTAEPAVWGGPLLVQASLQRLEAQNPLLAKINTAPPESFASQQTKLQQGLEQLRQLNRQVRGVGGDEILDQRLWKGSGILHTFDSGQFQKQLINDLHQEVRSIVPPANGWQSHESEQGFTVQHPSSWSVQHEVDGRYRSTYFRSQSPHLFAMVENGERVHPAAATVIDWTGMERSFKEKYGIFYTRISMGRSTLGGREVSTWEFKLKKPDGPELRKRYLGYSTAWNSVIFTTVAPADAWDEWAGAFHKMTQSFEFTN
jgi:prepilin-type processing-associated H-X9-DG protein